MPCNVLRAASLLISAADPIDVKLRATTAAACGCAFDNAVIIMICNHPLITKVNI